jgi:hypothetical protein
MSLVTTELAAGTHPVEQKEIDGIVDWCWRKREHGELWRPGYRHWSQHAAALALADHGACALFVRLRGIHPGDKPFPVANAMHKSMHMNLETFKAKRTLLVVSGRMLLL